MRRHKGNLHVCLCLDVISAHHESAPASLIARCLKLLNSIAALFSAQLSDVDVTLGIDRQGLCKSESSQLMARAAEFGEDFAACTIQYFSLLVVLIQDIHERL